MTGGDTAATGAFERLLRPRSVVIVGASPTPGALGASVLANLERAGFPGEIHLINPRRAEIGGRRCLPSVDELPEGVDCAVLAIPRAAVLETIRACGRRGVGAAIIFASGFAEAGEEGRLEQEELARLARATGMVIEGPNCLGMVNFVDATPLTFVETPVTRLDGSPCVAIVSQSGAMAAVASVSLRSRHVNVSYTVSTGNEAASGVEDYLAHLIDDDATRVISLIVEQFRAPQRFLALARRARAAGKLIVLVHPGESSAARQSAATHTGAIAGDHRVMAVEVAYAGVVRVETLEELLDVSEIAVRCPTLPVGGAMVMAESGWFKAQTLDLCERVGLELPALSGAGAERLRAVLPDFIPPSNPLDVTAQGLVDPDLYRRAMTAIADEDYGCIFLPIILTDETTARLKLPPMLDAIRALEGQKPVIFAGMDEGAEMPVEYLDALRALRVPFFPSPERALRALARLSRVAAADTVARAAPTAAPPPMLPPGAGVVPEYASKTILAAVGIPVPAGRLARTADEACAIADEIGWPVVLKAQSADLSHKSDAGGVVLNLPDAAALAAGWARLHADVGRHRPGLALDGVLVETMGRRGVELIVGARNDPGWGAVILVGMGGVLAEILHDNRLMPAEVTRADIVRELEALKSRPLFDGYRGEPPLDVEALADIVERVGQLIRSTPRIVEIDINPVVLHPRGQGAIALDALMLLQD